MSTQRGLQFKLPIVGTFKQYEKKWLRFDLVAGLTVAAVAIPQAMAYAQLAGAPYAVGLYAAFAAMLFFAIFSTTRMMIVGPDAAVAALTGAALLPFAANSSTSQYVALVALLAILIGLASFVALAAQLSFLSEFLSRPILLGYMAGLALAVIASQAPRLFGLPPVPKANFFASLLYIVLHLGTAHLATVLLSLSLGLACYVLIRFMPKVPVSLVVMVGSIIVSYFLHFSSKGIAVVGTVPTGLPSLQLPRAGLFTMQNLIIPAFSIMMISYANTIATARSFAAKEKRDIEPPQELLALGVANIGSGLFGGLPVAASGARTAINHQTKAASQVSQLFGAAAVAIVLLLFAPALSYLPLAALAVIIIMAMLKLFDVAELKAIWTAWRSEALLVLVTMVGVTVLGIFQGLLLAVFLAIINTIRKTAFPSDAVLGIAADGSVRDVKRPPKTEELPGLLIYRFDAPLYFGNANYFHKRILELVQERHDVHWVLWDAETITSIDSTAGAMLPNLIRELKQHHITFAIARMKGPMRQTMTHAAHLSSAYRSIPHYTSMGEAIAAFEAAHPPTAPPPPHNAWHL